MARSPTARKTPTRAATKDVPGVHWLQPGYFDKVVVIEKCPCHHFVHGDCEAWIDVETHLPGTHPHREAGADEARVFGFEPVSSPVAKPPPYPDARSSPRRVRGSIPPASPRRRGGLERLSGKHGRRTVA